MSVYMPPDLIVTITYDAENISHWLVTGFCRMLIPWAKEVCGHVWTRTANGTVVLRIRGLDHTFLQFWVTGLRDGLHELDFMGAVQIYEESLPEPSSKAIPWGSIDSGRLTRKLLYALPDGVYVMSNIITNSVHAVLHDRESREALWQHAQAAGVTGRLCRIFWSWNATESRS